MTPEDDDLCGSAIARLRADPTDFPGAAAKSRVAARLALGAGLVGAGASAATTAVAASGAGAVAGAVPVAFSLLALAQTFGVGILLGTGVGVGMHAAFSDDARRDTAPAAIAASVSSTPHLSGAPARLASPPASSTVSSTIEPEIEQSRRSRVNPIPELPHPPNESARPAASERTLAEQQTLLDSARAALRSGDAPAALTAMQLHQRLFPHTAFEEEREAVVIKSLVMLGRIEAAREKFSKFERAFPNSLLLASLRASSRAPTTNGEVP